MIDTTPERDTIAIDSATHDIYRQLTEGSNILDAPFKTMKDAFMWAVCLGMQQGQRIPLTGKKVTIFRWAQLDSQIDVPLLKAIAIAESGDVSVLLRRNDMLNIAEEYANAGIYALRSAILDGSGQPLWNLVNKVHEGVG